MNADVTGAARGKAIQAISKIYCIRCADDHEREKQDGEPSQIADQRLLVKRNEKLPRLDFVAGIQQK